MQDNLPDLPRSVDMNVAQPQPKSSFLQRLKNAGSDDKRLVKLILIIGFGALLLLGIAAAVLEQVVPRDGKPKAQEELFSSSLWQIQPQPNQIVFGFFVDTDKNNQFDYQERAFSQISVAIRRAGETEPFRRVSADRDGLVKIDDLSQGDYEVSYDNYSQPEVSDWLFFEEYQHQGEFFPTAWRRVSLDGLGYKELIGVLAYRPPLLVAVITDNGLSWYDPERARVYAKSNLPVSKFVSRGNDIYYLRDGKLFHLDWTNRTVIEEMIWLEEAEAGGWTLSPGGKTIVYSSAKEQHYRSQIEACNEGSLLWEGLRPEAKAVSFIDETSWLTIARTDTDQPWQLFKVNCDVAGPVVTVAGPVSVGYLGGNDWFYGTAEAGYFYDSANKQTVKYTALGGGGGVTVSADNRYLLKKLSQTGWLAVDYPAVKTSGVEKHYLLTGIVAEPTVIGDDVYFVRGKVCEADGDCGEIVKISLQSSGAWSIAAVWDLKNVAAQKVLGVVN